MSWNGAVKAGVMVMELGKKDPRYPNAFISHINGHSTGFARKLFPYTFTFTSFATKAYKPILFVSHEKDEKEIVDIKNSYKSPGAIHHSSTNRFGNKKLIENDYKFAAPQIHDAITAMLYVRGQPLKNGTTTNLCILPFSSPYYANITVLGRETHNGKKAIKLSVKLQKIEETNNNLKQYKKLKKPALMWISDDAQRILLELRSEVFIGDVRAVLTKQQNLPK